MKKQEPLGRHPYACPDCPNFKPFRSEASYGRHRQLRHPAPDVDPTLRDVEPAALDLAGFELGELAHGSGALPSLDYYDGARR